MRLLAVLGRPGRGHRIAGKIEEAAHRIARDGAAEQPALGFRAAELLERGADLFGFHALRADRNVERVTERGDRVDDLRGALALHDGRDEALVDLDPVERQAVDLREARIARAKIVERDADADIFEALDDRQLVEPIEKSVVEG